jgi:hypothetical protein
MARHRHLEHDKSYDDSDRNPRTDDDTSYRDDASTTYQTDDDRAVRSTEGDSMAYGADPEARRATAEESQRASEDARHEAYGGFNIGAAFFGWLVAVALTVLLASITGGVAAAVGESLQVTQTEAEREAGTYGVATAVALLVILMIAYYAGGYVAGRMSRYDGARQGVGAWLIGLIVTAIAVGLGVLFGREYDIMQRVDLPSIPIPTETLTWGGAITLAAVLVGTFVAAMLGGKVGERYHRKIDRVTSW